MKKFCKYCQSQTEHSGSDCLECESLSSESMSDYSDDEYESDFIDDSELSNYSPTRLTLATRESF